MEQEIFNQPHFAGLTRRYCDGQAYNGLQLGELGDHGAEVRVEKLVLTDDLLDDAYTGPPLRPESGPFPGEGAPEYIRSGSPTGRVKLADEAFEFCVSMPEFERLGEAITWIDLSFVERQRTPSWAIYEAIQCHIAGMSLRDVSTHLETHFS